MDRQIVYPGAIPLDSDILNVQRNTMEAIGFLAQAALGTATLLDGLALSPASPATMVVTVGPGSILAQSTVDTTAFGSLPADSTDPLMKMGVNIAATAFTLTAPTTAGQSINYLIEATLAETDTNATVLPDDNPSNPATPYSGPANAGTAQNTQRLQRVSLQLKAGTATTTGTQATPAVDSGWVGLYVVTVNYGQTQITATNLGPNGTQVVYPGAPFIGNKIPNLRQRLSGNLTLYVSPTGNDGANGLSAATPFATMQKAWNTLVANYDLNGYSVVIQLAAGTYTSGLQAFGFPIGATSTSAVTIQGSSLATPSATVISVTSSNCFALRVGCNIVTIQGLKMVATGTSSTFSTAGIGILVAASTNGVYLNAVEFGACGFAHIYASHGGFISIPAPSASSIPYTVSGGAVYHALASDGGFVGLIGAVLTISNTPAFSGAFLYATVAELWFYSNTVTGSATGSRYTAINDGNIFTNGGYTSSPGNAAGSTATGGQVS